MLVDSLPVTTSHEESEGSYIRTIPIVSLSWVSGEPNLGCRLWILPPIYGDFWRLDENRPTIGLVRAAPID